MTVLPFSFVAYLEYDGSTFNSSSAISPSRRKWITSLISACMNTLGTSHVAISRPSFASIRHVMNNASTLIVGELVSSLLFHSRCFCPSAHPRPFMHPHLFCLRNMRYLRAAFFCAVVSCPANHPCMTFLYTNCSNSFFIASAPASPNCCRPLLADICSVKKLNICSASSPMRSVNAASGSDSDDQEICFRNTSLFMSYNVNRKSCC